MIHPFFYALLSKVFMFGIIPHREEEERMDLVNSAELIANEISKYAMLLRIKADSKEKNPTLEYEIRVSEVLLHSLGVNTEDLKP